MKARTLRTVAIAAVVILVAAYIGAYILGNLLLPVHVEYMGLTYRQTTLTPSSGDELYYTGVTYNGAKLYIPVTFLAGMGCNGTEKVPSYICVKRPMGYNIYQLAGDNPAVFAYVPYERYNIGERVTIGLMDRAAGRIELRDTAPYEIQANENGKWNTIFTPAAAQASLPLENGTCLEWSWDQKRSDGSPAGTGEYRALVDGQHEVRFTITEGTPVVRTDGRYFNQATVQKAFFDAPPGTPLYIPELTAFADYYHSGGPADDVVSEMAFKAWKQGLPADKLRSALKGILPAQGGIDIPFFSGGFLPCLAVHATFDGKPAWLFVVNWGTGGEKLDHLKYYAIDDATGEQVYYLTCK